MTFEKALKQASRIRGIERLKFLWFEAWKAATAKAEKRAKEREAEVRLDEAQWWEPRTVTHGLGWQHEECRKRLEANRLATGSQETI
jgi:hypothetical protein